MTRSVCIHGHFYQPPRENPWLEEIEQQDSAYPYQDWNERICAECYAPNTSSRILDDAGNIIDIVNNYSRISFNFGPTLLSWMEKAQPDVYQSILEADALSLKHFSGHGSAMAQAYNHMILPLANARDKRTQVLWGARDFEHRFKRRPEGMWLPETAVDVATLEILAQADIRFTVLAPSQAHKIRRTGTTAWEDVPPGQLNPQQPYLCRLPSGRSIVLFFYDGPISSDIAFSGLLKNGEHLAGRLMSAFPAEPHEPRLVHIATDGETYGHHHRFGNMALSYCLNIIASRQMARLTIYGEYLDKHPPEYEVMIFENSAWSCAHGVERWRSDCGCRIGGHAGWHQKWRAPLRAAMDWLRDELADVYQQQSRGLLKDAWAARDDYIHVLLDRSAAVLESFFSRHAARSLTDPDKVKILKLMEMQRHAMFMYTSCGWFFDEISGLETTQILQYAARAIQLAQETAGVQLEEGYIQRLEQAPSNLPEYRNGGEIYKRNIRPRVINLLSVGAHYAIASLFQDYPATARIYSYEVSVRQHHPYESGKLQLVIGVARIQSLITLETSEIDFAVIYFGDYNLNGGVRVHAGDEPFAVMREQLSEAFLQNDIPEVIQRMNDRFRQNSYSLWDLFKNEQGKVLNQVFDQTLESIETHFREIYEHYYPLMRIRPDLRIPLPKALSMTVEFILNRDMVSALEEDPIDLDKLERLAKEMKRWNFTRDKESIAFVAGRRVDTMMENLAQKPLVEISLKPVCELLRILGTVSLTMDLWRSQNIFFALRRRIMEEKIPKDKWPPDWTACFNQLGQYLRVKGSA